MLRVNVLPWRRGARASDSPEPFASFVRDVAGAEDSAAPADVITHAIHARAGAPAVSFFNLLPASQSYAMLATTGIVAPDPPPAFAAQGRLARWLRANDRPLFTPDPAGVFDYLPAAEQQALCAWHSHACLPLVHAHRLVAFLIIRGRPHPSWSREHVASLTQCAKQAAGIWWRVSERRSGLEVAQRAHRSQQLSAAGQLAATMAHEIRNPLAAIRSLVQVTRDLPPGPEAVNVALGNVLGEVDRIGNTVERLLHLSRPHERELVEIDGNAVVRDAARFVEAYARRCGVQLHVDGPVSSPLLVRVDPLELRQVIVNMVLNACQACEAREREGVVRIGIALGQENADNRMVEITVRDTGRGIAAPDVERVFEPFFTTRSDGMGLGLSFCRDVLRRCGGDIAVVETTNTGTTIVVRLPLWSEHDTRSGR